MAGDDVLKYPSSLGVVLFGVWLLWSGHYTALLIGFGVASSAGVAALAWRMGIADSEGVPLPISARLPLYLPWLGWQIVKSNLDVARRILTPGLPIRPHVVVVRAGQRTDLGRTVHANSITMTPGTVSVAVQNGTIRVHALSDSATAGLAEVDRRVTDLEGRR